MPLYLCHYIDCLNFNHWDTFSELCVLCTYILCVQVFTCFLLYGTRRCFKLGSTIHLFSMETYFHLLENGIRFQDLAARCINCYWDSVASKYTQLTKQGNICVYKNSCMCIDIYIYILLYIAICIYVQPNMNSNSCFQI